MLIVISEGEGGKLETSMMEYNCGQDWKLNLFISMELGFGLRFI